MNTGHTDRHLLELAAKAAGYAIDDWPRNGSTWCWAYPEGSTTDDDGDLPIFKWNPLADDGDALRLAVKLNLIVGAYGTYASVGETFDKPRLSTNGAEFVCGHHETSGDPLSATRRAIVLAAAAIGKAMP